MVTKLTDNNLTTEFAEAAENALTSDLLMLLRKQKSDDLSVVASVISCKAKVSAADGSADLFLVKETQTQQSFTVKRASSCLQVPREGDVVHIQVFPDKTAYILAVLETASANSDDEKSVTLKLPEKSVVEGGELQFVSERFALSTQYYLFDTLKASINSVSYQHSTTHYQVSATHLEQKSKSLEVIAEESTTKVVNANKYVSGTERIKALNINYSAEALAKVSANVTMLHGRELLKSDGKLMVVG